MRKTGKKVLALMSFITAASCGAPSTSSESTTPATAPAPSVDRKYLLERVDDAAVVQVYADGFNELPLKDKTLVWHLYQAAIAGRDIYFDQRHAEALAMRDVIEAVVRAARPADGARAAAIDPATLAEVERYAKLFWVNSGPYNNLTAQKFVLTCTPEAFATAVRAAVAAGAPVPLQSGETLDQLLARLQPMFFDPAVDPMVTAKTPPAGKAIISGSANNLYAGVTMKDVQGYTERYPLNARLAKKDGKVVEEVYRVNGRYGKQIAAVIDHLQAATAFATEPMANALRALIKFYQTGETADRVAYDIAWVADQASPVDT